MILYNLRKTSDGFMLAKFGPDFNVEAVYHLTAVQCGVASIVNYNCDCPAGGRPSCKHRKMLARMIPKADSDEFYCYELQIWHKPLALKALEPMQDKLDAFYATVEEVASEASSEPTEPLVCGPDITATEIKERFASMKGIDSAKGLEPLTDQTLNILKDKGLLPTPTEPPTFRRRV